MCLVHTKHMRHRGTDMKSERESETLRERLSERDRDICTAPPPLHVPGDLGISVLHRDEVVGIVVELCWARMSSGCKAPGAGDVAVKRAKAAAFCSALLGGDAGECPGACVTLGEVFCHVSALGFAWARTELVSVSHRCLSRWGVDVCWDEFRLRPDGRIPNAARAERRDKSIAALEMWFIAVACS